LYLYLYSYLGCYSNGEDEGENWLGMWWKCAGLDCLINLGPLEASHCPLTETEGETRRFSVANAMQVQVYTCIRRVCKWRVMTGRRNIKNAVAALTLLLLTDGTVALVLYRVDSHGRAARANAPHLNFLSFRQIPSRGRWDAMVNGAGTCSWRVTVKMVLSLVQTSGARERVS
jgi:hypothetical protein